MDVIGRTKSSPSLWPNEIIEPHEPKVNAGALFEAGLQRCLSSDRPVTPVTAVTDFVHSHRGALRVK
jgi:hypothetical protein